MPNYSEFFDQIITHDDRQELKNELESLQAALFRTKGADFDTVLKTQVRDWVRVILSELIKPQDGEAENKEKIITDLLKILNEMPVFDLKIAFEPTRDMIEKMHAWISKQVNTYVLLDIHFDPQVIGGALISYAGKYGDFSLRKKMDETVQQAVQEFLKNANL